MVVVVFDVRSALQLASCVFVLSLFTSTLEAGIVRWLDATLTGIHP